MKKLVIPALMISTALSLTGCAKQAQPSSAAVNTQQAAITSTAASYENGTYRGAFLDSNQMQVNVEFKLENNIIKEIKFRHLQYKDVDYLKAKDDKVAVGIKGQHQQLIDHLVGKDVKEGLKDLYKPENIVKDKVDTFTGATLRSTKIVSAVRDGLNRGVYSYK